MINAILNKHLPRAFDNQLRDAVKSFEGSRKGTGGTYDPITDTYVGSTDVTYSGRGVFGSYKIEETKDTQIGLKDVKLTCLQIEVTKIPVYRYADKTRFASRYYYVAPLGDVVTHPKPDDIVVQGDNEYRIIDVKRDPTSSIWIMQLRGLDDNWN